MDTETASTTMSALTTVVIAPNFDTSIAAPHPNMTPIMPPASERNADSIRNWTHISVSLAPSALRIPISLVLSSTDEIAAFCGRLHLLRPDLSLFVVDTALRLSDKILPMFLEEFQRRGYGISGKKRIAAQLWALTPRIYLVNGSRDLMTNIGKAIAAGFRALAPEVL